MSGNNLSVEKVVKKIDKDKFSALSYCIFYIMEFCNQEKKIVQTNPVKITSLARRPQLYSH